MSGTNPKIALEIGYDPKGAREARKAFKSIDRDVKVMSKHVKKLSTSYTEFYNSARIAMGFLRGNRFLVEFSDQMNLLGKRIQTLAQDQSVTKTFLDLQEGSRKTLSSIKDFADGFTQLKFATEQYGLSTKEVVKLNQTIANSFRLTGATTQEASAASRQLIQAIRSNRLGGDEFRSVRENAPYLVKIFAEELGIAQDEIKKAAEAGLITTDVMLRALEKNFKKINAEAEKLGGTIMGELTVQTNELGVAWQELDRDFGITEKAILSIRETAEAIKALAQNVDLLAASAAWFFIGGRFLKAGKAGVTLAKAAYKGNIKWANSYAAVAASAKKTLPILARIAPYLGVVGATYFSRDIRKQEMEKVKGMFQPLGDIKSRLQAQRNVTPESMRGDFPFAVERLLSQRMDDQNLRQALEATSQGITNTFTEELSKSLLDALIANPLNRPLRAFVEKYYEQLMEAFYQRVPKQYIRGATEKIRVRLRDAGMGVNLLTGDITGGFDEGLRKDVDLLDARKKMTNAFQNFVQNKSKFDAFEKSRDEYLKLKATYDLNREIYKLQKSIFKNAVEGNTKVLPLEKARLKVLRAERNLKKGAGTEAQVRAAKLEENTLKLRMEAAVRPEKQKTNFIKEQVALYREQEKLLKEGKIQAHELEKHYLSFLKKVGEYTIQRKINQQKTRLREAGLRGNQELIPGLQATIQRLEARKKLLMGGDPNAYRKEMIAADKKFKLNEMQREIFAKQRELFDRAEHLTPVQRKLLVFELKVLEARKKLYAGDADQAAERKIKLEKKLYELQIRANQGGTSQEIKNIQLERENAIWREKINLFREGAISLRELDEVAASMHNRFNAFEIDTYARAVRLAMGDLQQGIGSQVTIIRQAVQNIVYSAEDVFIQFAKTGKLAFRDFANAVIDDLLRVTTRILITKPIVDAFARSLSGLTSGGAGGGGGGFGSIFGGGEGSASPPTTGAPIGPPGGDVVNIASLGKPYTITVENRAPVAVSAEENPSSGELTFIIEEATKELVNSGRLDTTYQQAFGLQRRGLP